MQIHKLFLFTIALAMLAPAAFGAAPEVLLISAEGVADPQADVYARDKGLMMDHLRADAQRNAVEKAVGCVVSSETLSENFQVVNDRILKRSKGFIRRIVSEDPTWTDDLGLVHLPIQAEVVLADVKQALNVLSRDERIQLIRDRGNPKLLVSMEIGVERDSRGDTQRSPVAENLLKEHFSKFGYRIWSFDESKRKQADFHIQGTARLQQSLLKSSYNDLTIPQYLLHAWSIRCADLRTGEEIYFNNTLPGSDNRWGAAESALADIAKMVAGEFSDEFFANHLMAPTTACQLEIKGVPSYTAAKQICRQFVGLRQIISAELADFQAGANSSTFIDVVLSGSGRDLGELLDAGVVTPYNEKTKKQALQLTALKGNYACLTYAQE